ncbi:MAG: hypothetical protein FWF92_06405 [Oscillospiraceae bacterium]|nr:hypothetical protein [Oscillospiraceae bacterium]
MKKTFFKEQPNGYDKEQVDNYIRKLMKSYEIAYSNYLETFKKYYTLKHFDRQKSDLCEVKLNQS